MKRLRACRSMASPLPTATWPSISALETTSHPVPIEPAPIAVASMIFLAIFCLGFILQPSKSKPMFRRDEEDCLDHEIEAIVDSSTKELRLDQLLLHGSSAKQASSPTMFSSVDHSFPTAGEGPESSRRLWNQGATHTSNHMSIAISSSATNSSNLLEKKVHIISSTTH